MQPIIKSTQDTLVRSYNKEEEDPQQIHEGIGNRLKRVERILSSPKITERTDAGGR